ncbi:cofactor assembly of complex C subunit B [Spirulina sp. CS-785/01]|uniref:cofactor assembly of complex C subunit B n=1 Tax=Spirulina sp. CS-785/01 TaxID=3021716 RepID=UPI00232B1181|nr:cofactor assembly of complex C subunit B [Spirulina sp. CS-785/01]MDB9314860.1 cofactor assembly of complex C subunit B [Spirulina sp. CS-785/01]
MNPPILSSTLLLTLLLMVGLFFFIRASTKERIEQITLIAPDSQETLLPKIQNYFEGRSYQLAGVDAQTEQVTYKGLVSPSWFLAIFLSFLAAIGLLCLALVLNYLFPGVGNIFFGLVLFSPLAGYFYWKKSERVEEVLLKVESLADGQQATQNLVKVRGHRDELAQLQQSFSWTVKDWE